MRFIRPARLPDLYAGCPPWLPWPQTPVERHPRQIAWAVTIMMLCVALPTGVLSGFILDAAYPGM